MKNLILIGFAAAVVGFVAGCNRTPLPSVTAETPAQATAETNPFLKELVSLPLSQRLAFTKSHKPEVEGIIRQTRTHPELLQHLRSILKGTH